MLCKDSRTILRMFRMCASRFFEFYKDSGFCGCSSGLPVFQATSMVGVGCWQKPFKAEAGGMDLVGFFVGFRLRVRPIASHP